MAISSLKRAIWASLSAISFLCSYISLEKPLTAADVFRALAVRVLSLSRLLRVSIKASYVPVRLQDLLIREIRTERTPHSTKYYEGRLSSIPSPSSIEDEDSLYGTIRPI